MTKSLLALGLGTVGALGMQFVSVGTQAAQQRQQGGQGQNWQQGQNQNQSDRRAYPLPQSAWEEGSILLATLKPGPVLKRIGQNVYRNLTLEATITVRMVGSCWFVERIL